MKDIIELLKSKGISPSLQRIKILKYLSDNPIHPSVDVIYNALSEEIPTLSRTTVYNTLSLFRTHGIINIVPDEVEIRYDANTESHGHFKCIQCQKIYDFPVTEVVLGDSSLDQFQVQEKHIYYSGICAACKNKITQQGENDG